MLWIVRNVDLVEVACSDEIFKTRKEAEEFYREQPKDETVDLLVQVFDMIYDDYDYSEFELTEHNFKIIKKR